MRLLSYIIIHAEINDTGNHVQRIKVHVHAYMQMLVRLIRPVF